MLKETEIVETIGDVVIIFIVCGISIGGGASHPGYVCGTNYTHSASI